MELKSKFCHVERSHEQSEANLVAQSKHPCPMISDCRKSTVSRKSRCHFDARAKRDRRNLLPLSRAFDGKLHRFFIRAPIRNNFLTVPVGSPFI